MPRSFLSRLARATGGNTLAMLAAFLIPLSALTGSAVDMGRLYLVKVRLQQACDAGALAGRKFMIDSNATTLDTAAANQAATFFANNFPSGIMGTPAYTPATVPFTATKTADKQVAGTATTTVPMTIMKMFGQSARTITVSCEARYDVADTDVMFVLDTTGSMACAAADTSGCSQPTDSYSRPDGTIGYFTTEKSNSKLSGLRTAVLNFYDTLAANVDASTHVRYGFVTYTSTVNAGYALPADALVSRWTYQSRYVVDDDVNGASFDTTYSAETNATCTARAGRNPATGYTTYGQAVVLVFKSWTQTSGTGKTAKGDCVITTQQKKPLWRYGPKEYDVSQFVTGAWVPDPSKITGTTAKWQGCLEERNTTPGVTSFDINNLPPDLDPDLPATDAATRWRPMWPDVIYYRPSAATVDYSGNGNTPYGDYWPKLKPPYTSEDGATTSYTNMIPYAGNGWDNNIQSGYVSCGKPVQRLALLSRSDVSAYVNATDFKAQGGTYHDTGMIWGTRMIAPRGIFASDTAAWPGRNSPNRYIVFMTDGDMAPNASLYGMYGIEKYDKRVSGGDTANLTNYHNQRFLAECAAAKARDITVFVVGFGQALTNELRTCASPGQAFYASDNDSLTAAFRQIANQVAMLRVSK